MQDIRWIQRLSNYQHVRQRLTDAVELAATRELSDLEKQGLTQTFEFVFELAWNLMKDYFVYQGNPDITGSRDAIRSAFKAGLVADGEGWMEMIKSRNQSLHTYNESVANEICGKILESYHGLFEHFEQHMQDLARQQQS
ncbi:MAG: nucleotidyltransferase substrate binding protein [Thiopseudomonas sp.]